MVRSSDPTPRSPTSIRLCGGALVLLGAVASVGAVEQLWVRDEYIRGAGLRDVILVLRGAVALLGFLFLVGGRRLGLPSFLGWIALPVLLAAVGVFGYGDLVDRGIVRRPSPALSELSRRVRSDPASYLSPLHLEEMRERLPIVRAQGNRREVAEFELEFGRELMNHGKLAESIEVLVKSVARAEASEVIPSLQSKLLRTLGIAELRRGEVEQCIETGNAERCRAPIVGAGVWSDPAPALRAIRCFQDALQQTPSDLGLRWLLNIATMTIGGYPQDVPALARVPGIGGSPRVGPPRFRDIAQDLGVASLSLMGGAILDDFDGNGFLDVITSSYDPIDPIHLFLSRGDGTFESASKRTGLQKIPGGNHVVQADYDNDGRLDVVVVRGGWMKAEFGRLPKSLLHQEPDGTFTDVAPLSGIARSDYPCQTACWADFDLDGDVDLYFGNERFPSQLFRNDGEGRFVDVAVDVGVCSDDLTKGAAWGDYDDDGDPDLYVSNHGGPNLLFRNDGGKFHEVAHELGVDLSASHQLDTFLTWFFDYDDDGHEDLFVASYPNEIDVGNVCRDHLAVDTSAWEYPHLFRNDGHGGFEDVSQEVGLAHVFYAMGGNFADVDNDGWLDFHLGTGAPSLEFLVPDRMVRNEGGQRFVEITAQAGVGHLQKGHGVAFGDLDNDGDVDLLTQMGGFYPGDRFYDSLYLNEGPVGTWVALVLEGSAANRSGIGARVRVTVEGKDGRRTLHRCVGTGGSFGSNSLQMQIGLGGAERIETLEVDWPGSGTAQHFADLEVCKFYRVREDSAQVEPLARKRLTLAPRSVR